MPIEPILHASAIAHNAANMARKNEDLLDSVLQRLNELEMRVSNLELKEKRLKGSSGASFDW